VQAVTDDAPAAGDGSSVNCTCHVTWVGCADHLTRLVEPGVTVAMGRGENVFDSDRARTAREALADDTAKVPWGARVRFRVGWTVSSS
jgi:hypothetical protein